MEFSLIVCTYMRPKALTDLLNSVNEQTKYPDEIIIVDGSLNEETKNVISNAKYSNLHYFLVEEKDRGLTKQRNFGINIASKDILCFLDDDIVLTPNYFEELIGTYREFPNATGIGGYIIGDIEWKELKQGEKAMKNEFQYDNFIRKLGSRNSLRKKLGLLSNRPPGEMPEFSNGLSISFLPPSNKVYKVDYFMGGVSSFKKSLFDDINFSEYFEGYGLYEDADFCLRASKKGDLYVNTRAQLYHYHDDSGRPNKFDYGKMVIRNGWYVWRIKFPNPSLLARIKWHTIALLLTLIKFSNIISTAKKKESFTEGLGRVTGWFSLLFNKPKLKT
ncbi:MAG: glycosyltransferase [Bacteroidia bacterium]|nr:glycosyltransferase [Bacteroidia bacterium]NNK28689.1 glycosyltransferase family 2 protein [Flavobacteriaceae bacterium]